ncbi:MAG TPA: hypothetical protein VFV71_02305 [Burkholderiales bacterium]|nr:hypothetical protein [Burkholderiales bacterium]
MRPSEPIPAALRAAVAALSCAALLAGCAGMQRRPPPSLEQIVEMSKAGKPAEDIVRELQDTRAVYPLTASQIVRLHERGVSDSVLDYMQGAYAESIRWNARMDYEARYWWWNDCFYCYYPYYPVIVVPR